MRRNSLFIISLIIIFSACSVLPLLASDQQDAKVLQDKCTEESKELEIAVKNFGDQKDLDDFEQGLKLIKLGKVKFIQSKFVEAINQFNEYLKLQYLIYQSLSTKYLERTAAIIDEVGVDLVDYADDPNVKKYLGLAVQNLDDARKSEKRTHYNHVINGCRMAKRYALQAYKLVEKEVPEKYSKDLKDNDKKM